MNTFKHLYDTGKVIYEGTSYGGGDIEILDATEDGKSVRILLVDGARESASFNDPAFRNDLVFKYAIGFHEILLANPHLKSVLLIGGAGFAYPKHFISHFPDKTMDVVEIDKEMVALAYQYFYLEDLFFEYDLHTNRRLQILVKDGFEHLKENQKIYDCIINDAYLAYTLDSRFLNKEGISLIKKNLSPNGIYIANVITSISGTHSNPGKTLLSLLKESFHYTSFKRCTPDVPAKFKQNCLFIGSNFPI